MTQFWSLIILVNEFMCKDGVPCDSVLGQGTCISKKPSTLRLKRGSVYFCSRILLRGGVGWGMSLYEKLERQGLLKESNGAGE
jgi:hypothetical protein